MHTLKGMHHQHKRVCITLCHLELKVHTAGAETCHTITQA
jgi:hypothetical protein